MVELGVSYWGNRIPHRVREDMEEIRRAGCTYVVHTFSEEDLEFYLPAMEQIVAMTHDLGMEAWLDPWGVGQAFGGETYSSLVAKQLSLRQVNSLGESLPIACPNQPAFRDYLTRWTQTAKKLKADLIFWDEPHFMIYPEQEGEDAQPKLWACRCPVCRAKYQEMHHQPMPERMTPQARAFKESCLVDAVRFLCDLTRQEGMKSCVCLLPFENSSTVTDWAKVAAIPSLDILSTDPYWRPHQPDVGPFVGRFARRLKELADRFQKGAQLWILNFNIPKGEEDRIRVAVESGYKEGIRNFAAWSYYGAAPMSLKAEDPEAVWRTLSECYHRLGSHFD